MKLRCENNCKGHFDFVLDATVRCDGSFYETHLADLKLEPSILKKLLHCTECAGEVIIEDYN